MPIDLPKRSTLRYDDSRSHTTQQNEKTSNILSQALKSFQLYNIYKEQQSTTFFLKNFALGFQHGIK